MKICLNMRLQKGPFGGGMQFANFLKEYLEEAGHEVVNSLQHEDIDVILHVSPFPFLMDASSFSFIDAYAYQRRHPNTKIILRINECDSRKGTHHMDGLMVSAAEYVDHIVFIASWLKPYYAARGIPSKPSSVILNGADTTTFNRRGHKEWSGQGKLKIVTHHWGASKLKGHDIYVRLDQLLGSQPYKDLYAFTYVGNFPDDVMFRNSQVKPPQSGKKLAAELKKHHIYLTASVNEPAGMHHIEGALCGLPLLYRESGALPEYCNGFGVGFDEKTFLEALDKIRADYFHYSSRMPDYDNTAKRMGSEYLRLIERLASQPAGVRRGIFSSRVRILYWKALSPLLRMRFTIGARMRWL